MGMVQKEFERRNKNKLAKFAGASIFGGELVCADCGSFYGQKVWYSNGKYQKII